MWYSIGLLIGTSAFELYINDSENCLESMNPDMYADDTSVKIASEELNELLTALKTELENISNCTRIEEFSYQQK